MKTRSVFSSLTVCFATAMILSVSPSRGASVWNGSTSSDWGTATNWTASGVPDSNTTIVQFTGNLTSPANRTVTLGSSSYTTMAFQFSGNGTGYNVSGGTVIMDKQLTGGGISDGSTRNNFIASNITVNNTLTSCSTVAATSIAKTAVGTLTLNGTVTTTTNVNFNVNNGGAIIINGNIVGGASSIGSSFNQTFQMNGAGSITVGGSGVSSTAGNGSMTVTMNTGTALNLNRTAALAAKTIVLQETSPTGATASAINLGADDAIVNVAGGTLRTQNQNAGNTMYINTNGHSLNLSNETFDLFHFGNTSAILQLDMGAGNSDLWFANSSSLSAAWHGSLAITNFTFGTDSIRFGTDSLGLTSAQLGLITINGVGGVTIDSSGYLVPEPSTWVLMLGGLATIVILHRRRRHS